MWTAASWPVQTWLPAQTAEGAASLQNRSRRPSITTTNAKTESTGCRLTISAWALPPHYNEYAADLWPAVLQNSSFSTKAALTLLLDDREVTALKSFSALHYQTPLIPQGWIRCVSLLPVRWIINEHFQYFVTAFLLIKNYFFLLLLLKVITHVYHHWIIALIT